MKNSKFYLALVIIGLQGCADKLDVSPTVTATAAMSEGVRLVAGRLVFTNEKALDQTLNCLAKMDEKAMAEWEDALGFQSLRYAYSKKKLILRL